MSTRLPSIASEPSAHCSAGRRKEQSRSMRRPLAGKSFATLGWIAVAASVVLLSDPASAGGARPWVEVRSPNFVVYSDASAKKARRVAWQFEQIQAVFRTLWRRARVDSGKPIVILAAKNERTLRELLPRFWERKGAARPAGFFLSRPEKHYMVLRLDVGGENPYLGVGGANPYSVLYHEYVHLLIVLNFKELPVWLNEGLAEFYAGTVINKDELVIGGPQPYHIRLLRQRQLLPLDVLLAVDRSSPHYNERNKVNIFYAQSWAMVHYLLMGDKGAHWDQLRDYLRLLLRGEDDIEAARRTFGDLTRFEKTLAEYMHNFAFYTGIVSASSSVPAQDYPVRELSTAESYAVRGDFHVHNNRWAEARKLLEEALKFDPQLAPAHESLALLCLHEGRLEEALSHRLTLLEALSKMGRVEEAAQVEQSILMSSQIDTNALGGLAAFYERSSRPAEAETLLRNARDQNPQNLSTLRLLGYFLVRQERYDEAESVFREALAVHPEDAVILNDLGYMNADRGVRVEEALTFIEMALKLDPHNGHYLDGRGWALYRLKRFAEAEKSLRKALAKEDDAVVLDHLGDVLQQRGKLQEALECWRRALSRGDTSAELKASLEQKIQAALALVEGGAALRVSEADAVRDLVTRGLSQVEGGGAKKRSGSQAEAAVVSSP